MYVVFLKSPESVRFEERHITIFFIEKKNINLPFVEE